VWVRIFSRPSVRRTPVKETRPEKTVLDCMVRLCILSSSPSIVGVIKSRRMRWAGNVARMGEEIGVYGVLVGKPERRIPLGRPRHIWVDYVRKDVQEVGCVYMD